ncbi:TPA: hypothetical protein U8251_002908 [Pseudomonas putida]|nr:hypothetical protein [Pseudomonas putida]
MSYFFDHTTFESDAWNDWSVNPTYAHLVIIIKEEHTDNHCLSFAQHLLGTTISKTFSGLTSGTEYVISARVKRLEGSDFDPELRWTFDGHDSDNAERLTSQDWHTYRARFTASGGEQRVALTVRSLPPIPDSAPSPAHFLLDEIWIHPSQCEELFDGSPQQLIREGAKIDREVMTVHFVSGEGQAGIHRYTYQTPGKLEKEALAMGMDDKKQELKLDLNGAFSQVDFQLTWLQADAKIQFFSPSHKPLHTLDLKKVDGLDHSINYRCGDAETIASIVIEAQDHIYMDFFKFTTPL